MTTTTTETRVIKAGGAKGDLITGWLIDWSEGYNDLIGRKEIAEAVGCTVGRVGETLRWLSSNDEEKAGDAARAYLAAMAAAKEARKAEKATKPKSTKKAEKHEPTKDSYRLARALLDSGDTVPAHLLDAANAYAKKAKTRRLVNPE